MLAPPLAGPAFDQLFVDMRLADLGRNVMFYFGPLSTVKQLRAAIFLDHILTTKGADLTNEGKEKLDSKIYYQKWRKNFK